MSDVCTKYIAKEMSTLDSHDRYIHICLIFSGILTYHNSERECTIILYNDMRVPKKAGQGGSHPPCRVLAKDNVWHQYNWHGLNLVILWSCDYTQLNMELFVTSRNCFWMVISASNFLEIWKIYMLKMNKHNLITWKLT